MCPHSSRSTDSPWSGPNLLRRAWGGLRSPRFFFALALAAALECAFLFWPHSRLAVLLEDVSMDWVNRMYQGTAPVPGRAALPFTIIDIDDQTYRDWREPPILPRSRLVELIRFSVENRAAAVVVDVDLSRRGDGDPDRPIARYLGERSAAGGREGAPPSLVPVVLVRTFQLVGGAIKVRPSRLDDDVRASRGAYWAAPLFERDEDFVVRRWRLWQPTCGDVPADVVPSVQLLILSLASRAQTWTAGLEGLLSPLREHACVDRRENGREEVLQVGSATLRLEPDKLERRIIYTIPWNPAPGRGRPTIRLDGRTTPLLITLPAGRVVAAPALVSSDTIRDRVVVIGGSFTEGRDLHLTPIGVMPGTFVLANSIHSILQYGEVGHLPVPIRIAVLVVSVVCMSVAFHCLGALRGLLISFGGVCLLILASLYLLRGGVWLEFAVSFVGMMLHHLVEQVIGRRHA